MRSRITTGAKLLQRGLQQPQQRSVSTKSTVKSSTGIPNSRSGINFMQNPTGFDADITKILLHLAFRDHLQGTRGSGPTKEANPLIALLYKQWSELNDLGPNIFSYIEAGGQEFGASAMSGHGLLKVIDLLNLSDSEKRILIRGCYANSLFPLGSEGEQSDLFLWYDFLNRKVKNSVFKPFDYNCNLEELEAALEVAKRLKLKLEMAVPHSPEPEYEEHFRQSFAKIAKLCKELESEISIKRMVTNLNKETVLGIWEKDVFEVAKTHDLAVSLHAHGPVEEAIAAAIYMAKKHRLKSFSTDIVPGNEGTFPHIEKLCEILMSEYGIDLGITDSQWAKLGDMDRLANEINDRYKTIKSPQYLTNEQKERMGKPDGADFYTAEALEAAKIAEKNNLSLEKLFEIFEVYYIETRKRFGNITSVTPGNDRLVKIIIPAMLDDLANTLKETATKTGKNTEDLTGKEIAETLKTRSYQELFQNMPANIANAFRNRFTPRHISNEGFEFLCQTHMKAVLTNELFSKIPENIKSALIKNATNKQIVTNIAAQFTQSGFLPKRVIFSDEIGYLEPDSLVQAAGLRKFPESAGIKNKAPEYREMLARYQKEGLDIGDPEEALMTLILTGDPSYVVNRANYGNKSSAELLSPEQYAIAKKIDTANLGKKKGEIKKGMEAALTLSSSGIFLEEETIEKLTRDNIDEAVEAHRKNDSWRKAVASMSEDPGRISMLR